MHYSDSDWNEHEAENAGKRARKPPYDGISLKYHNLNPPPTWGEQLWDLLMVALVLVIMLSPIWYQIFWKE